MATLDAQFYQAADQFFAANASVALTYDDVTLATLFSDDLPRDTKLDAPLRLQGLAERHLPLKPIDAHQYDDLKNLPERPPSLVKPGDPDPIGSMIHTIDAAADAANVTGSVPEPENKQ